MTTLTAEPNDDSASVTLKLTPTESIASIMRSDVNGNALVRVPVGTFPRTTPLEIIDWEASLGTPVTYTVTGAAADVQLGSDRPWFVAPFRPAKSLSVDMVTEYGSSRASLSTLHQVTDRPDPLVALGRLTTRAGTLRAWVGTLAEGRALEDMIDRSGVVFFKQIENLGQDMYFTVSGTELGLDPDEGWILTINYQEINRPTSPITETSWTFGTVSTSYSSFANVSSNYTDFEGLSLNDQTGVV